MSVLYLVRPISDGTPVEGFPGYVWWRGHMIWLEAWAEIELADARRAAA